MLRRSIGVFAVSARRPVASAAGVCFRHLRCGVDVDNDSVFMNETLLAYCEEREIAFTRSRPWHKNDQAFVEQKNGSVVRRIVGNRRLEGLAAAAALSRLYGTVRLFVNFFQPSFKLSEKIRDGARVLKRYHRPATPCQRLLDDTRTSPAVRDAITELQEQLDPVHLLQQMRRGQQEIADLADGVALQAGSEETSLEDFFAALHTAWKDGEVRPTARAKPQPKRGRRRPDPFEKVTDQLRKWFDAEPLRTSRQLLEQLQKEYPACTRTACANSAAPGQDLAAGKGPGIDLRIIAHRVRSAGWSHAPGCGC